MSDSTAGVETAIHRMVELCRANAYPAAVARLSSGWVIMGERQVLAGYCLLLPDPVVGHLNALSGSARARFLADMALAGDAVMACLPLCGRAGRRPGTLVTARQIVVQ